MTGLTRLLALVFVVAALGAGAGWLLTMSSDSSTNDPGPVAASTAFRVDDTTLVDCSRRDVGCTAQALGNVAASKGPDAALVLLADTPFSALEMGEAHDPQQVLLCHEILHEVGSASMRFYRGDAERAIWGATTACGSGYQHAVLEQAFADLPPRELATRAARLCDAPPTQDDSPAGCLHGVGHGLALHFTSDPDRALETCDETTLPYACHGGALMATLPQEGARTDASDMQLCAALSDAYRSACYYWLGNANSLSDADAAWQARTCMDVEARWRDACAYAFGRVAWEQSPKVDVADTCRMVGDHVGACIADSLRYLLSQRAGGIEGARVTCARQRLVPGDACSALAGLALRTVVTMEPAERRAACVTIAPADARPCIRELAVDGPVSEPMLYIEQVRRILGDR